MSKIAIFPGSFSPFTIGHQSIVDRALPLFDKIVISVGINSEKPQYFSIDKRMQWIKDVYKNNPKIEVKKYKGLTVDFCRKENANYILSLARLFNYKISHDKSRIIFLHTARRKQRVQLDSSTTTASSILQL